MTLVGGAGALAVALVLLAAGLGHLRDGEDLRRALAAHGVLDDPALRRAVAAVLAPVELVLGVTLLVALAAPGLAASAPGALLPVLTTLLPVLAAAGASLLLAGFTAYLLVVLRRTRGQAEIPCGCGLGATPVGPWAVLRAAVLTGLGLVALLAALTAGGGHTLAADAPAVAQVLLVVAAGLSLAIATAALPAARAVPTGLTTLHGGRP